MPEEFHYSGNAEIAERFRIWSARPHQLERQRLLRVARIYDIESDLVFGSYRANRESRALLAAVEKLLG
jgi:hypothetical protein